jgi:FkbM family methyltransferase
MRSSDLIVDVGMCDGADTAFYLAKGFRIVAIEANPALVERATKRFSRELEQGSLTIVDKAIGPKPGRVQFHVHRFKEDWSSLDSSKWSSDSVFDTIDVDCVTLDSVLRQHGIPTISKSISRVPTYAPSRHSAGSRIDHATFRRKRARATSWIGCMAWDIAGSN